MNIPNMPIGTAIVPKALGGYDLSGAYKRTIEQLLQTLNENAGNTGLVTPSQQTSDIQVITNASPPPRPGTLLFDTAEINGGTTDSPNGQLKVFLQDGTFHAIPNL